jgi:hypothetical protein
VQGGSQRIALGTESVVILINERADWFPGSVWASVPRLTAAEKGFTDNELETRIVDSSSTPD